MVVKESCQLTLVFCKGLSEIQSRVNSSEKQISDSSRQLVASFSWLLIHVVTMKIIIIIIIIILFPVTLCPFTTQ